MVRINCKTIFSILFVTKSIIGLTQGHVMKRITMSIILSFSHQALSFKFFNHQQPYRTSFLSRLIKPPRPTLAVRSYSYQYAQHRADVLFLRAALRSNDDIVQARLEVASAKRKVRRSNAQEDYERNLRLKRTLHTEASSPAGEDEINKEGPGMKYDIPAMYAIRVSADKELRDEFRMNGREKRGRMFVEYGSEGCKSIKGLKFELHSFFRCLKKSSFLMSVALPVVTKDGSILNFEDTRKVVKLSEIGKDEDIVEAFEKSQVFFDSHNSILEPNAVNRLKRPSLLIYLQKNPNAPPPPPTPSYLIGLKNPEESKTMTMLSFYSFPPGKIEDAEYFALFLRKIWKPFGALGRVYIATEGVNAQMSVPTNVLGSFIECCKTVPELGEHMENGINIDSIPLTMEEFSVAGDMNGKPSPPFNNLHVRVRSKVVADGLDMNLDLQNAGYDMPPLEWHQKLKEVQEKREDNFQKDDDIPLIFDCRNTYETNLGLFQNAEPLSTETFKESWDVLKEKLKDTPKDKQIMTYCTGGIRCVKVGAYLSQELGFTNVSRLAGGIIAYDRTLTNSTESDQSLFKGTNYVFDGRVGRKITGDAIAECFTCGGLANLVSNCNNDSCHKRMVQCEKCRPLFHGTCSDPCKRRVINKSITMHKGLDTSEMGNNSTIQKEQYEDVNDYSSSHSTSLPSFYKEIEANTVSKIPTGSHMISGALQGQLLKTLASTTREGRILEIGTFTGYATACFLEAAANVAKITDYGNAPGNQQGGPFVMTLERDPMAIDIAASHISIMSQYGIGKRATDELRKLRSEVKVKEFKDKEISFSYENVGCQIVRVSDALATIEGMAFDVEMSKTKAFDLVFVDADKTRLLEYVEACVINDSVLKKGGLIVVDNTLWKGLVLNAEGEGSSTEDVESTNEKLHEKQLKKSRRARKLATKMHNFNSAIVQDDRVEVVLLPIRDGLSIIRKKN